MRRCAHTLAIGIYLVVGLVTFGHAAAESQRYADRDQAICMERRGDFCSTIELPAVPALIGAALWPLYWSWELQE